VQERISWLAQDTAICSSFPIMVIPHGQGCYLVMALTVALFIALRTRSHDRLSGFGNEFPVEGFSWKTLLFLPGGAAAFSLALFVTKELTHSTKNYYAICWLVILGLFLHLAFKRRLVQPTILPRGFSFAALGWIVGLLALLCYYSLGYSSWKFSLIGDEWPFFEAAAGLRSLWQIDWVEASGVYSDHPVALTLWQGLVMRCCGASNWSWRLSSSLLTLLCFYPLSKIVEAYLPKDRPIWQRRFAILCALACFGFSELVAVWSIIGKPHSAFFVPLVWTWFFLRPHESLANSKPGSYKEWINLWAGGMVAGLGTLLAPFGSLAACCVALSIVLIPELFSNEPAGRRFYRLCFHGIAFSLGFLAGAAPFLVQLDQHIHLLQKNLGDQTAFSLRSVTFRTLQTFMAWAYFNAGHHFLAWNVVDPIRAGLLLLGMTSSMFPFCRRGTELLIVGLVLSFVTGGLGYYAYPSVTRIHLMEIIYAAYCSLGCLSLMEQSRRAVLVTGLIVLLSGSYNFVKLHHYNVYERPAEFPYHLMQTVLRASPSEHMLIIFPPHVDPWLFEALLKNYGLTNVSAVRESQLEEVAEELRRVGKDRMANVLLQRDLCANSRVRELLTGFDKLQCFDTWRWPHRAQGDYAEFLFSFYRWAVTIIRFLEGSAAPSDGW